MVRSTDFTDIVHGHMKLLFNDTDYVASPDSPVLLSQLTNPNPLFCVNPLDGANDHAPTKPYHRPDKPRRADLNVSTFRNFIFESDTAPLEKQIEAISKIDSLVRLAVFSGNKSVSYIVSVADTLPFKPHTEAGVHDYKMAWSGLCAHIEKLTGVKMDPATKNPSRLTRTPGVLRPETGKLQEALFTGPLVTSDFVMSLMVSGHKQKAVYNVVPCPTSYSEFEKLLANERIYMGLRNKLQESYKWAQPAHMYPEILKISLWAIDSTGVTYDVLREYMWRYTFPALLEVGYERSKIEDGLINAYRYKGLL
jgi:hypothetical protein